VCVQSEAARERQRQKKEYALRVRYARTQRVMARACAVNIDDAYAVCRFSSAIAIVLAAFSPPADAITPFFDADAIVFAAMPRHYFSPLDYYHAFVCHYYG